MLMKGSFYAGTPLFAPDEEGKTVFAGLRARVLDRPEPILEHPVAMKERLDGLAQHYYADSRAWRRIAEANPAILFPEDLLFEPLPKNKQDEIIDEAGRERLGSMILIPRRKEPGR